MPTPRMTLLALLTLVVAFHATPAETHAEPLADEATHGPLSRLAGQVETVESASTGQAVRSLLDVFGWSIDGLGEAIAGRLAPPPLADPAPPWNAPPTLRADAPPPPPSTARGVVILDEASMAILCEREAHTRMAPASLTKVATAALAVQSGRLDEVVHNTVESWHMGGSSLMGLHPGDRFPLRDLLYGMMLPSGNDAALAIGRHLAGSDALFVYRMGQMVRHLGLEDTRFIDPHGLGGPGHYSSAYDLALISRYAMQSRDFREVVGAHGWTAEGSRSISMHSYVGPFIDWVEGADGLKTGFTYEAGPTFIGSASRGGHRLYVVLLNSQDRFGEAAALLEWAFQHHDWPSNQQVAAVAPADGPAGDDDNDDDGVVEAARLRE
ncbi:MAG: D-alanyl-D-alanine carboxypeptidase [Dehalococcoidia bacterium]|nr:D-alanyl-D-alanine carboxypeptidase [Dehalococcoidia bacterium]